MVQERPAQGVGTKAGSKDGSQPGKVAGNNPGGGTKPRTRSAVHARRSSSQSRSLQRKPEPSSVSSSGPRKVEKDIDPSNFKIGQVHLGDIRTAHKLWTIFPHDITTTDLVMLYAGGLVVPYDMEAQFRLKFVTDHRWGLYVQHQEPQPRPSTARLVLKPPTMKKRARDAARLHAQLSSVRLRLRSPSRTQLRLRSQGPPQYAESGGRRADAQKRPRSGEHPSGQRWWYMEQHKRDTATAPTVAIRTGAELKVSENDDAHAGAVIEFSHATGYGEGPKPVAENEKRVFILSKRGDFYPETVPVGTAPPEIAAAFSASRTGGEGGCRGDCAQCWQGCF